VLAARQRLLGLLLVLTIATGTLAAIRMAAWWVIVPPTVMLLSYVVLLRQAAKADAERRELARTRATARPARARVATRPTAPPAPRPYAQVINMSTSLGPAGKFYDQYTDAKRRAVGDLARSRPSSNSGLLSITK
jgi:hypothetical protein